MTDEKKVDHIHPESQQTRQIGLVAMKAGCLTFLVAGVAIIIGLWLDARLGTGPRWTLILLVASAPLAFIGVYALLRRALRRIRETREAGDNGNNDEAV